MAQLNKVFLMGNLTRDPELRYTPSGTAVCQFGLAVNRRYTGRDGEQKEDTCFVEVTMWGNRGVAISEYFTKGRPIFVEGRLKFDTWESPDGRRSKLSVVAENFQFIGRRGDAQAGDRGDDRARRSEARPPKAEKEPEDLPDEGFDVADDEIPF